MINPFQTSPPIRTLIAYILLQVLANLLQQSTSWGGGTVEAAFAVPRSLQRQPGLRLNSAKRISIRANRAGDEDGSVPRGEEEDTIEKQRRELKEELIRLGQETQRGFQANSDQRALVKKILFKLAALSPTITPAAAYFGGNSGQSDNIAAGNDDSTSEESSSLQGKWTLIYTDAPDITGLDPGAGSIFRNPTVVLGRIGQDCQPPTISNVIEWKAPDWIVDNPLIPSLFKGEQGKSDKTKEPPRILQKVVTKASASPDNPSVVKLDLAGFKVEASPSVKQDDVSTSRDLRSSIAQRGLIAGLLEQRPLDVQGPLTTPFGEFELLYLDADMRITRTGQNFFAINQRIKRPDEAWF